jgi:Ca2+-binding RTX toxin-like protein
MPEHVDRLELRRHLDGSYARLDREGVLRVFGTAGDDRLELTLVPRTASGDVGSGDVGSGDLGPGSAAPLGYTFAVTEDGKPIPTSVQLIDGAVRTVRLYLRGGDDTVVFRNPEIGRPAPSKSVYVDAGAGDDSIATGPGHDVVLGGAGNDTIFGDRGNDRLEGGSGADDLRGGVGNDTLSGGGGNDRLRAGGGNDVVNAGRGNDRIYSADNGTSTLRGEAGNDTLFNGSGQDAFSGGAGEDLVDYGARRERLYIDLSAADAVGETLPVEGGTNVRRRRNGNLFDDGRFTVDEKRGSDPFSGGDAAAASEPIKPYLVPLSEGYAGVGSDEADTLAEVEHAVGGSGADVILGSSRRNVLRGGAGNDSIFAGSGTDDVYGDGGDDSLFTADTRDAFPSPGDPRHPADDWAVGGEGNDFARVDNRDRQQVEAETVDRLRALLS